MEGAGKGLIPSDFRKIQEKDFNYNWAFQI